jgi:hypothetical protein
MSLVFSQISNKKSVHGFKPIYGLKTPKKLKSTQNYKNILRSNLPYKVD